MAAPSNMSNVAPAIPEVEAPQSESTPKAEETPTPTPSATPESVQNSTDESSASGVQGPISSESSPKTLEDNSSKQIAHADYIYEEIKTYGLDFDTEIEAKAKDLAVLKYRKQFQVLKG